MIKKRWALVSTASDNLGEAVFPHQQVLAFGSETEAILHAADLLCQHDEGVQVTENGIYIYKGQYWTAAQLIVEWRETNLDDTGLFHIWEVVDVPSMQDALESLQDQGCSGCDVPCCREIPLGDMFLSMNGLVYRLVPAGSCESVANDTTKA